MSDIKVLVLLGSLRAASINRQLAELAAETAPDGVSLQLFDRLGELPFYNEDIDNDAVAEPVEALRAARPPKPTPPWSSPPSTTAASPACSRTPSTGCPGRSETAR